MVARAWKRCVKPLASPAVETLISPSTGHCNMTPPLSVATTILSTVPNSAVAGRATVFIFPDLNTGNTTYKAVQRSADCVSVGPMLQGLRKPVNDLSRGALVDDIVFTIALTVIQATKTVVNEPV